MASFVLISTVICNIWWLMHDLFSFLCWQWKQNLSTMNINQYYKKAKENLQNVVFLLDFSLLYEDVSSQKWGSNLTLKVVARKKSSHIASFNYKLMWGYTDLFSSSGKANPLTNLEIQEKKAKVYCMQVWCPDHKITFIHHHITSFRSHFSQSTHLHHIFLFFFFLFLQSSWHFLCLKMITNILNRKNIKKGLLFIY